MCKQMSTEFVKQTLRENLARTLVPHIADGLWSVYDNARVACERNKQPEMTLQTFQNLLTRIPQWSDEILNTEVDRITVASKCDYIEDLLLGVFVSYIRAFASLQQSDSAHVNIEFDRPSISKFIHAFYKLAARKSWSQAYLFKTIGVNSEHQARNRRDIEAMLQDSMNEVIDGFIPWREISKAYFHAKEVPPTRPPTPMPEPPKPVTFGEHEIREYDAESEDDEEEERPRLQVGEDVPLDLEDEEVDIETELQRKATETVSLNL